MQATRFRAAALLALSALAVSASAPGCGDGDEPPSSYRCNDCGSDGGEHDAAGAAGEAIGVSGGAMQPLGGAGAATDAAGASNHAGVKSDGGQGGASGGGATGGEGGAAFTEGEQLDLCARLTMGSEDAAKVQSSYVGAVYYDCRVTWLVDLPHLADLNNQVFTFNYNFWGCPKTLPVDEFGLVLGKPMLSQGDADVLMELYLASAQKTLALSPLERDTMAAALVRLSKLRITDSSLTPSRSTCSVDMGGAGGAGGADAGGAANGIGGAP